MKGQTISHYKIIEKLGEGGMGVVYKAQDTKLDRLVALKFLPQHLTANEPEKARFLQEAKAASALNHPNVCTIYGLEDQDGQQFIEMEYVDGVTLRSKVQGGALKIQDAITLAIQIGEALTEAHSKGIVHRDIKPENVMVNTKNQVKVMDFGLAKLKGSLKLTRTSSTVGTLAYMSPEQVQGEEVDPRSDIFSFGILLYEMLTGHTPFRGEHEAAMMYSIVNEKPEELLKHRPEAPADLERIISRTLEKEPEDRYQHADDLVSELRRVKKQSTRVSRPDVIAYRETSQTTPEPSREPAETPQKKGWRRIFVPIGGFFGLVAIGLATYFTLLKPTPKIDSMAVLPFINLEEDPETEYLSDGFTESLINSLSKLPGIRMMSRSSVFRYKDKDIDPQTAGLQLGVDAILTGRLSQRGDALSISVELVNARDNSHIWGEQYNRKLSDILSLQSEITRQISNQLKIALTGAQEKQLVRHETENTGAYQSYLKGRFYWNKRTPEAFKRALEYFKEAIEADPSYALAYVGMADTYALMSAYYVLPPDEAATRAKAAAKKALELDENTAEAHTTLAALYEGYDWDWVTAENEFKRAIRLNPNYATAHQWYGEFLAAQGRIQESLFEMQRAQELDPLSPIIAASTGWIYLAAKESEGALKQVQKALELDPNFPRAYQALGFLHLQRGEYDEAIENFQKSIETSGGSAEYRATLAFAYGRMGRRPEAEKILRQFLESAKKEYVAPYLIGTIYTGLGNKDSAFAWFDRAIAERSNAMEYMKMDVVFEPLHPDPRYALLLKKVGLPE